VQRNLIEELRLKIKENQFEYSRHAVDQSILRGISVEELREAVRTGQVIEDYPDDKYGPTLLLLGFTPAGRPLHIQCSYPTRPLVKIVTLYQPDAAIWADYRTRRNQ
jgi:hypothetical protein